jgi:multidrug efflux pump subunit AcrB/ABC-type multidrug transport system ATPase subunit
MLFIGLVLMGIFSNQYLPMELYPNAELPELSVGISYNGKELDPTYVESKAAIPVEGVISSLEGVEEIETTVDPRQTRIRISFSQSVNIKYTQLQLEEKILAISKTLPEDEFRVTVSKGGAGNAGSNQLMNLRILGDDLDYVRNVVDVEIVPYFEYIDGVAEVTVSGGRQKSIEIIVDPDQLKALNITKSTISSLISQNQADKTFSGIAYDNNKRYFVNVTAEYLATEDLGNIVVASGPILLRDIAEINFGVKEQETYSRANGKEIITCRLSKSPTANIIDLAGRVREEIERLNGELQSKGIVIEVESDASEVMSDNINKIIDLALTGALLAIFVLYLFLRKLRIVSVVTFSIPISVFSSFCFFYLFDITINTLTLTGIALAVGMLLDNSIVVMENIYRLKAQRLPDDEATARGTREVWKSIFAATITTVTVFLPFLFTDNYQIKLLGEHIGISIIATLSISLLVALLLIPMAINYLLKRQPGDVNFNNLSIHNRLVQIYRAILKMALRAPTRVILVSLVALFLSIVLSQAFTLNVLREPESDSFRAVITPSSTSTLQATDEMVRGLEEELLAIPEIEEFTSSVAADEAILSVKLKEDFKEINNKSIVQVRDEIYAIAKRLRVPDIEITTTASASSSSGGSFTGNTGLLRMMGIGTQQERIVIKGEDFEEMTSFGDLLLYQVNELDNVSNARLTSSPSSREAKINFDPYLMGVNDITPRVVSTALNSSSPQSRTNIMYKTKDAEYEIVLQDNNYDESDQKTQVTTLADLRRTPVQRSSGDPLVELQDFSRVNIGPGQGTIRRKNQTKDLNLVYQFSQEINGSKTLLEVARQEIDELVQNQVTPSGVGIEIIHEESEMGDFTFLVIAALLLIYMILAAVFESLIAPVVLMFSIPLAAIGSLLALLLTSNSLENATVYIGFIILVGIVINNSIILIDYTTLLRRGGNRKPRAILLAGMSRLRPILITAITTVVALVPLALGQGEYVSGIGAPFAITVIGGLGMSTLLTLVIIPALYSGMEDALQRVRSQGLFMKTLQAVLLAGSLILVFIHGDDLLDKVFYTLLAVILVPGVTWFLESSLRRATSNIIPSSEELVITITNLVKIYGRPSLFNREWNSGVKIRERLGLKAQYRSWRDLQPFVWLLPVLAFMYYFTFIYQELFLWAVIFGVVTWAMTLSVLDIIARFTRVRAGDTAGKIVARLRDVTRYLAPVVLLWWAGDKFYNDGGAIFLGLFWYAAILARYLAVKIHEENINIDLISGRFRAFRKSVYRAATKMPLIGIPPKPFKALSSVSMEIRTGMFGLLGPNGAGKTTLMRVICGVFEQSYGKIFINGIDTLEKREELQGLIGYLPQEFGTYENLTAAEFLDYQALLKGISDTRTRHDRVEEVLAAVHMFENKDKRISSFSGGMKQRIGIAQTLLNLPRILVVDEPTAGLDPRERIRFRNLLVELSRNRIVIFSTHIIEDIASSCNQVGVINKGELKYLGTPADMANIAKDVTWSFEVPVRDFARLPADLLVVHHIRQGDLIKVRCLCERKPTPDAVNILPALEDSYLWLLRNVKIQGNERVITSAAIDA